MEKDDDDSFVPDSLKGFFAAADKTLQDNLAGLLDESAQDPPPEQVVEDDSDFLSPSLEPPPPTNPAAYLTHDAAKDMAMEGVTPTSLAGDETEPFSAVVNLQRQLDDVAMEERAPRDQPPVAPSASLKAMPTTKKSAGKSATPRSGPKKDKIADIKGKGPKDAKGESSRLLEFKGTTARQESAEVVSFEPPVDFAKHTPPSETKVQSELPEPRLAMSVSSQSWESSLRSTGTPSRSAGSRSEPISQTPLPQKTPTKAMASPTPRNGKSTKTTLSSNDGKVPVSNESRKNTQQGKNTSQRRGGTVAEDQSPQRPYEISFSPCEANETASSPLMPSPTGNSLDLGAVHLSVTPSKLLEIPEAPNQNDISMASSPLTPRLLKGTAASQAKHGNQTKSPASLVSSPEFGHWKGRKELTTPDKIPSRLLQATSSSRARFSKEPVASKTSNPPLSCKPISSRLLETTQAAEAYLANSPAKNTSSESFEKEKELAKAKLHSHAEHSKLKQNKHQKALQDRIRQRQKEQREKRVRMQEAMARARQKREKLEEAERQRQEKLKQQLKEKEARALQQRAKKEKESNSRRATVNSLGMPSVPVVTGKSTVPVAPAFRTEQRLKTQSGTRRLNEVVALAKSDDILKRGPRSEENAQRHKESGISQRRLTIPKGPRLSTSKRHAEKADAKPRKEQNHLWEAELRSVSSPLASDRSASSRLTIPQTPKFQEIRQRPRPKSTAEKEAEEMEYFKSHPFKANPVILNDAIPASKPTKPQAARQLTTPSPFQFRTDRRLEDSARRRKESALNRDVEDLGATSIQLFKARPMPKYNNKTTPLTGTRPTKHRPVTTPEPFHFRTTKRHSKTPQEKQPEESTDLSFKARPMPNFSRPTGIAFHLRSSKKGTPKKPEEPEEQPQQFKARPMPDFSRSVPLEVFAHSKSPKSSSKEPEPEPALFRAKKMPNLSRPSIPVRQRDPIKLRSPDKVRFSPTATATSADAPSQFSPEGLNSTSISSNHPGFHARPAPKRSPPSIPVKQKDPSKLRSPSKSKEFLQQAPTNTGFKARKMPNFYKKKPATPSTTLFKTTPTLSSPNLEPQGESPPKKDKLPVKDKLRQRLKVRLANGARTCTTTTKFSSTSVRDRLQQVAPVISPEPTPVKNSLEDGVPKSIDCSPEKAVDVKGKSPEQSRTPRAGTGAGPRSFSNSESDGQSEWRRQLEAAKRMDETMQMAYDLQRAAEDELSFHGSISSREQVGYADEEFSYPSDSQGDSTPQFN